MVPAPRRGDNPPGPSTGALMTEATEHKSTPLADVEGVAPAVEALHPGMVRVAGGVFLMGSDRHYPEERPVHQVRVDGFWIDRTPVTNREFRRFIEATGYVTFAEIPPDAKDYPGALPHMLKAGSLVFTPPRREVDLNDWSQWWQFRFGAFWRRPYGPGSSLAGLEEHPVVHIAYRDAEAYAHWAGKELPTEAEWERAARGGLQAADYAWGDELTPGGRFMANYWQGRFPTENLCLDGFDRTSPVRAFPPNGYGLYDMIGNVWEWTASSFDVEPAKGKGGCCCVPEKTDTAVGVSIPQQGIVRRVLKGGSHLCAENYCQRYRPAARYPQPIDTSTSHVGFRCLIRCD